MVIDFKSCIGEMDVRTKKCLDCKMNSKKKFAACYKDIGKQDLEQVRYELSEIVDNCMPETQAKVEAAMEIVCDGKVLKNGILFYIDDVLTKELDDKKDADHIYNVMTQKVTPEDCLYFFKQCGYEVIE